ncbi:MAG: phytanoyl-CoA dioxygenase family protein, partial [Actinomycetota bacterium]|nr:phytanoyl-CoA dioxygenase family protein [Actinomycetota bacterium]
PLIGPDIVLFSSGFVVKRPRTGRRIPWHEDSAYWTQILSRPAVITVWLALDDSDTENGCMRVIPGSHLHQGDWTYEAEDDGAVFNAGIVPSTLNLDRAVDFELRRGEISVHDLMCPGFGGLGLLDSVMLLR